jgi:hypothetical protein
VNPFPEPLHDHLGAQLHRLDPHQGRRIDQAADFAAGGLGPRWNRLVFHFVLFSFTAFSRRSMRFSTLTLGLGAMFD